MFEKLLNEIGSEFLISCSVFSIAAVLVYYEKSFMAFYYLFIFLLYYIVLQERKEVEGLGTGGSLSPVTEEDSIEDLGNKESPSRLSSIPEVTTTSAAETDEAATDNDLDKETQQESISDLDNGDQTQLPKEDVSTPVLKPEEKTRQATGEKLHAVSHTPVSRNMRLESQLPSPYPNQEHPDLGPTPLINKHHSKVISTPPRSPNRQRTNSGSVNNSVPRRLTPHYLSSAERMVPVFITGSGGSGWVEVRNSARYIPMRHLSSVTKDSPLAVSQLYSPYQVRPLI